MTITMNSIITFKFIQTYAPTNNQEDEDILTCLGENKTTTNTYLSKKMYFIKNC